MYIPERKRESNYYPFPCLQLWCSQVPSSQRLLINQSQQYHSISTLRTKGLVLYMEFSSIFFLSQNLIEILNSCSSLWLIHKPNVLWELEWASSLGVQFITTFRHLILLQLSSENTTKYESSLNNLVILCCLDPLCNYNIVVPFALVFHILNTFFRCLWLPLKSSQRSNNP